MEHMLDLDADVLDVNVSIQQQPMSHPISSAHPISMEKSNMRKSSKEKSHGAAALESVVPALRASPPRECEEQQMQAAGGSPQRRYAAAAPPQSKLTFP